MDVELSFDRCLCCHASPQIVDVIVQFLLFERQIVPAILPQILSEKPSKRVQECFINDFLKIQESLREAFRSRFRDKVRQIVLLVGPAPYLPNDMYTITFPIGCHSSEDSCGSCETLSARETQQLTASLFRQRLAQSFKPLPVHSNYRKMSIFLRGDSDLDLFDIGFDIKDNFVLPTEQMIKSRSINVSNIRIGHGTRCYGAVNENDQSNSALSWFANKTNLQGYYE